MPHKGRKGSSGTAGAGGGGKGSKGHGDKKTSGTSKPGEKEREATGAKPTSPTSSQHSGTHTSGSLPSGKTQPTSATAAKESPMKPTGAKETQSAKPETAKAQSTKPPDTKHPPGEKQKEPAVPKSPSKQSVPPPASTAKHASSPGIAPCSQDAKSTPAKPKEEPKPKKETKPVTAGSAALAAALPSAPCEKKEEKKTVSTAASCKPGAEAGMDDALDDLIDTLGNVEDRPPSPVFTGPTVTETNTATYVEELGKKESTIPPQYRKLLENNDGKAAPPPKPEDVPKPMSEDDLADAFSEDFVSSSATTLQSALQCKPKTEADVKGVAVPSKAQDAVKDKAGDKAVPPSKSEGAPKAKAGEKAAPPPKAGSAPKGTEGAKVIPLPKAEGVPKHSMGNEDLMEALSVGGVSCNAPPDEKKPKMEGAGMTSALDELMGTLEGPEQNVPECPAFTGPEVTETHTATHVERLGERESTIPPKYRKLLENNSGKAAPPPKPQDVPKPLSEDELADEFIKDFGSFSDPPVEPVPPRKPKDSVDAKEALSEEVVSQSTASAVQSAAAKSCTTSKAPGDPLDALAGTLGKRASDPRDSKPAVDKVKEKTDKDKREKLGEDEETIPPDYRLKEIKDKDGKPLLPKPAVKPPSMTDTELIDALSEGFDSSPTTTLHSAPPPKKDDKKSVCAEVISSSPASKVHSGALPPCATQEDTISDDALDILSGTLGTREPDPDEKKPMVDVVKEKAKSEHVDRLGDRDETIPPEYRHLLDDKGTPTKPAANKEVKPEKPKDDSALLDALSEELDFCSADAGVVKASAISPHPPKLPSAPCTLEVKSGKDIVHPKPVPEKSTKPAAETAAKPVPEKSTKPAAETAAKPVPEKATKPAAETAAKSVPEKATKPAAETAAKSVPEKATKPSTEQACKTLVKDETKHTDPAKAKEQSPSVKSDSTKTNKI